MQEITAEELFMEFESEIEFTIIDVRSEDDYSRFNVEGPRQIENLNIPFDDFLSNEEQAIAQIPLNKAIRVICAKEESSAMIAAIINANGFDEIGFLKEGINAWGDLLVPRLLNDDKYELWFKKEKVTEYYISKYAKWSVDLYSNAVVYSGISESMRDDSSLSTATQLWETQYQYHINALRNQARRTRQDDMAVNASPAGGPDTLIKGSS